MKNIFKLLPLLILTLISCVEEDASGIPSGIPTVSTTAITTIEQTSARTGGTIIDEGASAIIQKGVCWDTAPNPDLSSNFTTNQVDTSYYSDTLANLTPTTTYYVRAYATNNSGTSYGNELSFTTIPFIPVGTYDGEAAGNFQINIPFQQVDTTFTNAYIRTQILENSAPLSYDISWDISSLFDALPSTFGLNADGTLNGNSIIITNQIYNLGNNSITINGVVNFDNVLNNILPTSNLVLSGDATGNITYSGIRQ